METHPLDGRTGRFPWQVVVICIAAAAISRTPALLVLAFGSLIRLLVGGLTGRLALAAVGARVTLLPGRIVAGELPGATVEITNRKPLPLPWLDARLFLVEGVEPPNPAPGSPRGWIDFGFPVRGRERVLVRLPVRVPARGAYAVGPLRLRAGDWLGFTQTERTVSLAPEIIAYPVPLSVRDRALASLRPLAEPAARRGLVPDPPRVRGRRAPPRGRRARDGLPSRAWPTPMGRDAHHRHSPARPGPRQCRRRTTPGASSRPHRVRGRDSCGTWRASVRAGRVVRRSHTAGEKCGGLARAPSRRCSWRGH